MMKILLILKKNILKNIYNTFTITITQKNLPLNTIRGRFIFNRIFYLFNKLEKNSPAFLKSFSSGWVDAASHLANLSGVTA